MALRWIMWGVLVVSWVLPPAGAAQVYVLGDGYKLNREGTKIWSLGEIDLSALKKKNRIWDSASSTITLTAARHETVAFQIIIQGGDAGASDVDVQIGELKGDKGVIPAGNVQLFKTWYVRTEATSSANCAPSTGIGWYPDALVPWEVKDHGQYDGPPFAIEKNMAQSVWVDLDVPRGTPAGVYEGKILVREGKNNVELTLALRVRDLELPAQMHHLFFANGCAADVFQGGGYWLGDDAAAKLKYEEELFRMARQHRITLGNMYYDGYHDAKSVLPTIKTRADGSIEDVDWSAYDGRWGKYLSKEGNIFGLGEPPIEYWRLPMGTGLTKKKFPKEEKAFAEFPKWIQKHWLEKGWDLDAAYVYLADEPRIDDLPKLAEMAKVIGSATTPPLHMQIAVLAQKDAAKITARYYELFDGVLDRWLWSANSINPAEMRAKLRPTDWIGFYQGNEPYCPLHVLDKDALALRAWSWIAWQYGIRFSCYYSITECTVLLEEDSYDKIDLTPNLIWTRPKNRPNGNLCKGVCFYPGGFVNYNLPIGNIRLKEMRRGQQDYEYMWMLAQKGQGAMVDADVKGIIRKGLNEAADGPNKIGSKAGAWETDPERWDAAVAKWADALEGVTASRH